MKMAEKFAALMILVLIGMVVVRAQLLKRRGIQAMHFAKTDRSDFLIVPFVLFYFYLIFAHAFHWPTVSNAVLFRSAPVAWIGVVFCGFSLILLAWSLVSFGDSFRVGIDTTRPDQLVTGGIFAYTRNPIYVAFVLFVFGQFMVFPNLILMIYLAAGVWLIHRQVIREEAFLKEHFGQEFTDYSRRVRRYI